MYLLISSTACIRLVTAVACSGNGQHQTLLADLYSASHSRVAPENVGLQKEQKYNTFVCHTCNEVQLCVLGIRKKGSWQHEKIR
jgi:hypothetical protein